LILIIISFNFEMIVYVYMSFSCVIIYLKQKKFEPPILNQWFHVYQTYEYIIFQRIYIDYMEKKMLRGMESHWAASQEINIMLTLHRKCVPGFYLLMQRYQIVSSTYDLMY
jgi:hypothetical protein